MTEPMVSDDDGKLYVTPAWFEIDKGRSHHTVRGWIRDGQARSITRGDTLYVHWGDALKLHEATPAADELTRQAAAAYQIAVADKLHPVDAVQRLLGVSYTQAKKAIWRARRAGLLAPERRVFDETG